MRKSAHDAWAKAVGREVGVAMAEVVVPITKRLDALSEQVDLNSGRLERMENEQAALYTDLRVHMAREEESK